MFYCLFAYDSTKPAKAGSGTRRYFLFGGAFSVEPKMFYCLFAYDSTNLLKQEVELAKEPLEIF